MGGTVLREASAGEMRVQFRIKDDGATEASTLGSPVAYRLPLRRAMHMLDCDRREEGQLFTFLVKFTPGGEEASGGRSYSVAVLER